MPFYLKPKYTHGVYGSISYNSYFVHKTLDVCHLLTISHCLHSKNAEYDYFRNFKTSFCKNLLIPGKNGDQKRVH